MQFYQYLLSFLPKKKVESPESATILPTPAQTRVSWKNTNSTDSDSTSLHKTFPHTLLLLGNKLWFNNFWEPYVLTFSLPLPFSPFSPWQCPNFSNQTSAWHLKRWECSSNLSKDWSLQLCPGMCLMLELHTLIPTITILFGDWVALCSKGMNMIFLTFRVNLRWNQKKVRTLLKMTLKRPEKCWI